MALFPRVGEVLNLTDANDYAREMKQHLGCAAVLLKGGHLDQIPTKDTVVDVLYDGSEITEFSAPRIATENTHGTGCTLAAAITAFVARGVTPLHDAVREAKSYIQGAIQSALDIGSGHGCLHHMWQHTNISTHSNTSSITSEMASSSSEPQRFSDMLWKSTGTDQIFQRILEHPFLNRLTTGTLELEAFHRFIIQDALYLRHYGRGLALIGARAYSSERISEVNRFPTLVMLCDFAQGAIEAELSMHRTWLQQWQTAIREEDMSPACTLYTSYLISAAYDRPFEEAAAAYLPCFWIYHRVGQELAKLGSPNAMYQKWIDQYASEEFGAAVEKMKTIVDQSCVGLAPQRIQEVAVHFKRTCQMEYMFWDAAFRNQQWPT
jgi:thiaminase (transcriptional activator TenA)